MICRCAILIFMFALQLQLQHWQGTDTPGLFQVQFPGQLCYVNTLFLRPYTAQKYQSLRITRSLVTAAALVHPSLLFFVQSKFHTVFIHHLKAPSRSELTSSKSVASPLHPAPSQL
ncbi:hypothetical protein EI94DRAFT_282973 [Lactarius quietus]|nr:hypothetical protein EI94DRAFT_282973 [Lactarius quietus]